MTINFILFLLALLAAIILINETPCSDPGDSSITETEF